MRVSEQEARVFLGRLALECSRAGIDLKLFAADAVELDGIRCAGWFGPGERELAVALGVPYEEWYVTALHEYCHMRQWIEDPERFAKLEEGEDAVFRWLNGEDMPDDEVRRNVQLAVELEGDCERRVIELVLREGLSVDAESYGRRGSAYAHFYRMVAKKRRWYSKGRAPYLLEEVWREFPKDVDPSWLPEERHYEAYERCFDDEITLS